MRAFHLSVWVMVTIFLALSVPSSLAVEKRFIFGLPPGAIEANDLPRGWASCYGFTTNYCLWFRNGTQDGKYERSEGTYISLTRVGVRHTEHEKKRNRFRGDCLNRWKHGNPLSMPAF